MMPLLVRPMSTLLAVVLMMAFVLFSVGAASGLTVATVANRVGLRAAWSSRPSGPHVTSLHVGVGSRRIGHRFVVATGVAANWDLASWRAWTVNPGFKK